MKEFNNVIPAEIHIGLFWPMPFGLMQIRSRRICAGIQESGMASYDVMKYFEFAFHGAGCPRPGGHDVFPCRNPGKYVELVPNRHSGMDCRNPGYREVIRKYQ